MQHLEPIGMMLYEQCDEEYPKDIKYIAAEPSEEDVQ
jgi:hypothetical protein